MMPDPNGHTPGPSEFRGMDLDRLLHNMTNHPMTPWDVTKVEELRQRFKGLGAAVLKSCPESRERSVALTQLEDALMWSVASIARNQTPLVDERHPSRD